MAWHARDNEQRCRAASITGLAEWIQALKDAGSKDIHVMARVRWIDNRMYRATLALPKIMSAFTSNAFETVFAAKARAGIEKWIAYYKWPNGHIPRTES